METPGSPDGGSAITSGATLLSDTIDLRQLQHGSLLQDAPERVGAPGSRKQRSGRLVRLAVWMTLLYLLPQNPRVQAIDTSWATAEVPWVPFAMLVTHDSLDKVLGRWYVVKDTKPRSVFHYPIYEWFDIWFDENDILMTQSFAKSDVGYVLTSPVVIRALQPEVHEFDEEECDEDEPGESPDENQLSMMVCAKDARNCTMLTLTRDVAHADGFGDAEGSWRQQQQQQQLYQAAQRSLAGAGRPPLLPCWYSAQAGRLHCALYVLAEGEAAVTAVEWRSSAPL